MGKGNDGGEGGRRSPHMNDGGGGEAVCFSSLLQFNCSHSVAQNRSGFITNCQ